MRLDLVSGFRRVQADRLDRGGVRLHRGDMRLRFHGARGEARHGEAQDRGAAKEGERGHDDTGPFPTAPMFAITG